MTFEVLALFVL